MVKNSEFDVESFQIEKVIYVKPFLHSHVIPAIKIKVCSEIGSEHGIADRHLAGFQLILA